MASMKKNVSITTTTQAPKVESKAVAKMSDLEAEMLQDQGAGFEEAGAEAYAIPFLSILQDLSPQTKKKMAGYVEGAKPGMLFQSVSQEVLETCRVIPCHYSQVFIEWTPRDAGGGFVAAHPAGSPIVAQAVRDGSRNVLPNGNELQDTRQHYVLLVREDGSYEGCLIAMKSTQMKYSRRWMSQMRSAMIEVNGRTIAPPMYAFSYGCTVEEEANEQGSWYSWNIGDRRRVDDLNLYRAAKDFAALVKAGTQKVNYDALRTGEATDTTRGHDAAPSDLDDNSLND